MVKGLFSQRTLYAVLLALSLVPALYYGASYVQHTDSLDEPEINRLIQSRVEEFQEMEGKLIERSRTLASAIEQDFPELKRLDRIQERLEEEQFWGAAIFSGNEPLVWDGFAPAEKRFFGGESRTRLFVGIQKKNNAIHMVAELPLVVHPDGQNYLLWTATLLNQPKSGALGNAAPDQRVAWHFFRSLPEDVIAYQPLSTTGIDSVGAAFISNRSLSQYERNAEQWAYGNLLLWLLLPLTMLLPFVIHLSAPLPDFTRLLYRVLSVTIAAAVSFWVVSVVAQMSYFQEEIPSLSLFFYLIPGFTLAALNLVIMDVLWQRRRNYGVAWKYRAPFAWHSGG